MIFHFRLLLLGLILHLLNSSSAQDGSDGENVVIEPPPVFGIGLDLPQYRLADVQLSCPEGWDLLAPNCYKLYPTRKSWPQALTVCNRYGSQLAKIHNEAQNKFVGTLAKSTLKPLGLTAYWIGLLNQNGEDGATSYLWSDGTSVSRYAGFWESSQPDLRTGSCVKAQTNSSFGSLENTWAFQMCNYLLPFVCQLPSCVKGSFFCLNGKCVSEKARCDGIDDCGDSSDEVNCPVARGNFPCLRYERGESGTFQSSNYPSAYTASSNCRWKLEGPINSRIQLKFDFFETEQNQDLVHILDGGPMENASAVIATLSGNLDPQQLSLTSATNMLTVRFRSDEAVQLRGFQATWKAVAISCGATLKAQNYAQTFTSPNYPSPYPNGLECVWTIDAPKGTLVTLDVKEVMLEASKDFLIVYDGPNPASPILLRSSDVRPSRELIVSTQNRLYVYFYSNYAVAGRGFSISYRQGCANVISDPFGSFCSPGNTAVPYANSQICSYLIEPPLDKQNSAVTLAINKFDVAADDYLEVYEGADAKGIALHPEKGFGGSVRPPSSFVSRAGKFFLVFKTNPLRSSTGWNITYSKNCPAWDAPRDIQLSTTATGFGTVLNVSCPLGYEFVSGQGPTFQIYCMLGGNWSESKIPTCQPRYCSPVPQIQNGFAVSATNVTFGGIATYECYKGFSFSSGLPKEEISCTADGKWTSNPICKAQTCYALPPFTNGDKTLRFGDGTGFGTVFGYECKPGFHRVGSPTILCQTNGQWSSDQPTCKRIKCMGVPRVANAVVLHADRDYYYDDSTKVTCRSGFKVVGNDIIRCMANNTFSTPPICQDINECENNSAVCDKASTTCLNLPGGYRCKCTKGYQSLLSCTTSAPIGLSNGNVMPSMIKGSSSTPNNPPSALGTVGWCGTEAKNGSNWVKIVLGEPAIVERIRVEKVGTPSNPAFTTKFYIRLAMDPTDPPKLYGDENDKRIYLPGNSLTGLPAEVYNLPRPFEAQVILVVVDEYQGAPCMKLELFGCRKTTCVDIDECQKSNGGCDQICLNRPGGFNCSCKDGYDLFMENGQGGLKVHPAESGTKSTDVVRYNMTCVARSCPHIEAPSHGQILSSETNFKYPTAIQFVCDFGFQMIGVSAIQCQLDGRWNGTVPTCIPALCEGIDNNTIIGMLVGTDSKVIPFGQNVSISCVQPTRPLQGLPFSNFRQCIYDPDHRGSDYRMAGSPPDCPPVDCGQPTSMSGANYDGLNPQDPLAVTVGSKFAFSCRPPYSLAGNSSKGDFLVRCNVDGTWDFGNLRCEGPVCVDPGYPKDGDVVLDSVEEGSVAKFSCQRKGFKPYPSDNIKCILGAPCVLSDDIGITSSLIPDGAFADNSDAPVQGYEPHKSRLTKSGWCGRPDAFIFLSTDLQRVYTITTLKLAGVGGSGALRGHVTKLQFFYKSQFSHNYDTYPVEFNTPPGNHNKMYVFTIHPPIRARYILLGVTEYDENPCLKFDLQGCLAPISPAQEVPLRLQVGWNSSVPECLDSESPRFSNCPAAPIYVPLDRNGQLLAADFPLPRAGDNSGVVAWTRVEPRNFQPPHFITKDLDVVYTAYDLAGNSAKCVVQLRLPDTQGPAISCPKSTYIEAPTNATELLLYFNETTVDIQTQSPSNFTKLIFDPPEALVKLNQHSTVTVTALDSLSNQNSCKFQVVLKPSICKPWSLPIPAYGSKSCVARERESGFDCLVDCLPGYQFVDADKINRKFSCTVGNADWIPNAIVPACVPILSTPVYDQCLKGYKTVAASLFEPMEQTLSQRCSSSVGVFVRILNVDFFSYQTSVTANYTFQILPSVLQGVFYDLCGLTLKTIFDLKIPGASIPVSPLLSLNGDRIAEQVGCPTLNASHTQVGQGFGCSEGEVLRSGSRQTLPECLPCPTGTYFANNSCHLCTEGTYQDQTGKSICKICPEGFYTINEGSHSVEECLAVCGNGMYSDTGVIPCQLCPKNTYSGPAPTGGYKKCDACPSGTFTSAVGSQGSSVCKEPCKSGEFSISGLQPCSKCPPNFFQPAVGQQRCAECPPTSYTNKTGSNSSQDCVAASCSANACQNEGQCEVVNHEVKCRCRPEFSGVLCETNENSCLSQPCFNGGSCVDKQSGYSCGCPQNFTGERCEFGPDECVGVQCPNGGVCQDLPGSGTTKCLCRTGYTGPTCGQVVNPCEGASPCKNGAGCQPLYLGRFKCRCLPGWTGTTCDVNIDDCASKPCALNATCKDGVNDFTCDCPTGFTGKRCHLKEPLCAHSPCAHGKCIDRLFAYQCICEPGWTGEHCSVDIEECASTPCLNGGTCRDDVNSFTCQCSQGFIGSHCQHKVDHCASHPCYNNGSCVNMGATYQCDCKMGFDGTHCEHNINECETLQRCGRGTQTCLDLVNDFKCQCKAGFTGEFCDVEVNECISLPCLNNGTCTDVVGGFSCSCMPGWTGLRCETEAGGCQSNPCNNDGKCVNLMTDYFCVCPSGVDGKNCERAPNRCLGDPCHNGGVCGDFGSRLECTCPKDFDGVGCQYEMSACRANACQNGAACVDVGNGYHCACRPGFTGPNCETNVDDCLSSPCPQSATCIDQINGHFCKCPFNTTGVNCDKPLNTNYELRFYDPILPASSGLSVPFKVKSGEITIAMWVKFATAGSRGTFLTLYHSQEWSYPAKVREILRFSSEGVRCQIFSDLPPLVLTFPANQRVNDGHWNHVSFSWHARGGVYSLTWNAVRAFGGSNYATDRVVDINAWITLGYPVSETPNEPKFVGSITRVNMWQRVLSFEVEIPSQVENCLGTSEIFDGLLLRWTGYNMLSGKVEKVVPSSCGLPLCSPGQESSPGQECSSEPRDKRGPVVQFCPSDIYVQNSENDVKLNWSTPLFFDENPIEKVEHNVAPNQVFSQGSYLATYVAYDNTSNIGLCNFWIHVDRQFCPQLPDPVGGVQMCDSWGPDLRFKACSIHCDSGRQFSSPPPKFFSCGEEGGWRPLPSAATVYKYPQCTEVHQAVRMVKMRLDYPAANICNNAGKQTLAMKLVDRLNVLNNQWKICAGSDPDGSCQRLNVTVNCVTKSSAARLKRDQNADYYSATVNFEAVKDPIRQDVTGELFKALSILQQDVLLKNGFNFANFIPNGRPDLASLKVEDVYVCDVGQVAVGDQCVPCAPGSYYDGTTAECQLCPVGSFQTVSGSQRCLSCNNSLTTAAPGSTSQLDCKTSCPAGQFNNLATGACRDCGFGFYQSKEGSFSCSSCGIGKTTLTSTATTADDCRDECPDGQRLLSSGICHECPVGTFRTKGIQQTCVSCRVGFTTAKGGAVRPDQCDIPRCQLGEFLSEATRKCESCPRGHYQDEQQKSSCKKCPPEHTTKTIASVNATSCYSTNQCLTGNNTCHENAICTDLDDVNDIPSYNCSCKPGYRADGSGKCDDMCDSYCFNGGSCSKVHGTPECSCREFFEGPRCSSYVLPKNKKVAYIAGGIGGMVAVFVILVVVIFMICFRFRKAAEKSVSTEKLPPASDALAIENSPTTEPNFLCGLPNYTEAQRNLAYYYEDEDECDTKTMFVGDGFDDAGDKQGANGTNSKAELYNRLKRVQNHMYKPGGNVGDVTGGGSDSGSQHGGSAEQSGH